MQYNHDFHLHRQLLDANQILGEFESSYHNRNFHHVGWYGNPYFLPPPHLTLFRMGLFGVAHEWDGKNPLLKICHTYPTR